MVEKDIFLFWTLFFFHLFSSEYESRSLVVLVWLSHRLQQFNSLISRAVTAIRHRSNLPWLLRSEIWKLHEQAFPLSILRAFQVSQVPPSLIPCEWIWNKIKQFKKTFFFCSLGGKDNDCEREWKTSRGMFQWWDKMVIIREMFRHWLTADSKF